MKILIITDAWHPQLNGVVRTYESLKTELESQKHIVKIIGPRDFERMFQMPGYKEIDLVYLSRRPLTKKILDFAPDTIHIATEGPLGWAARGYCLSRGIPFTTCYHTQFPDYIASRVPHYLKALKEPVRKRAIHMIKKFHAPSSTVLVTTPSIQKELTSWGIKTPMMPFTRGVDTDIFYPDSANLFDDLPRPIGLYVGRLAVEKNIEAFLSMPWAGSKVIVGHGPDAEKLKSKFPEAHFVGKKTGKELADHYRSADIFVFPSYTDTFGMVMIEALACGLPVAGHPVMGPQDIITDETLGSLNDKLTNAASNVLKFKSADTPEKCYRHVLKNYTWQKATAQFLTAQNIAMHDQGKINDG